MATYEAQCSAVGGFGFSSYFKLYVELTEVDVSVGNNTSKIQYNVYCQGGEYGSISAQHYKYFNLNGQNIINTTEKVNVESPDAYIHIASGTTAEILHNADGSKSVSFTAQIKANSYGVSAYISDTFTLSTIPRASTPSCITYPNTTQNIGDMGNKILIHMNRASSAFTHTVKYTFGNQTETIGTNVTNNVQWEIPTSLANLIPNSESGTGTITVTTYNGDKLIGNKSISFTTTVPNTVEFKPTITDIILSEAVDGLAAQFGAYIQNQSKLNCVVESNGAYSSSITSCKVVINGVTYNEADFTTDVLKLAGTNTVAATVIDSRGRKAELTEEIEVLEYQSPTITQFTANRCNEDGTSNEEGEYAKIEISATIKRLNDKNAYTYFLQYKTGEEQEYSFYNIELTEVKTDTDVTIGGSIVVLADGNNSFDYMLLVSDYFSYNINKTADIGTAFQLFNWKENGRGFAIGKVSEKDAFEVNLEMYYKDCELVDLVYPVGSIYMSVNSTNPSAWLGGEWEAWGTGRVPVGIDTTQTEFATVEQTGGEKTHTLTIDEMPKHRHKTQGYNKTHYGVEDGANSLARWILDSDPQEYGPILEEGGSQAHNNLQPYITCYMWKRIA